MSSIDDTDGQPNALALRGGRIYTDPVREPLEDSVLLIDGASLAAVGKGAGLRIPAGTRIIDCSGATVAAGFWNCHVHFTERKWADASNLPAAELNAQLADFARYGFTTVFDLSSSCRNTGAIAQRIERGEVAGPRILTTGEGIVPAGAAPSDVVTRMMGWMEVDLPQVSDPGEAAAAARRLVDDGVDAIKIFASGPPAAQAANLPEEAMRAVVQIAHATGKPVFVHPNTRDDLRRALNAGVDVIAHTIPAAAPLREELAKMADAGMPLTPTLMLWEHLLRHDRLDAQQRLVEAAIEQVAFFRSVGGTLLFGTDYGAVGADPAREYALMAQAGMSFTDILASLTTQPARRFGGSLRLGTLVAGSSADVVVLDGDTSRGAASLSDVRLTIASGRVVYCSDEDLGA